MNSLSNTNNYGHNKKCVDPCPPRFCECKVQEDLHPVPGDALLEIGTGSPVLINSTNAATITAASPLLIAQVTLDPTCFCYANLKIEFSSLITETGVLAVTDSVTIQLSRVSYSYGGAVVKQPLESFSTNLVLLAAGAIYSLPFSFIYGEENTKLKESTYVVEVVSATLSTVIPISTGSVQFRNANIAALAVGSSRTE
jgi:hypothetical protein